MQLYGAIQKAVLATIHEADFSAALPPLSDATWIRLLSPSSQTRAENERLEFLGDALMYATIGRQLYAQIPDGTPGLYTNVRAALHSNLTFSHLAEKSDILAVSSAVLRALTRRTFGEGSFAPAKSKCEVKATADLFETVIGAYYLDHGFEALCRWVNELYAPLIACAVQAHHSFRDTHKNKGKRALPHNGTQELPHKKRRQCQMQSQESKKVVHIRTARVMRSKRGSDVASSVTVTAEASVTSISPSKRKRRGHRSGFRPPTVDRSRDSAAKLSEPAVVIDLTIDSDSDAEDPATDSSDNEAEGLLDMSNLVSASRHRSRPGADLLASQASFRPTQKDTESDDDQTASLEDEYMLTFEDSVMTHSASDMDVCMSSDWDGQGHIG